MKTTAYCYIWGRLKAMKTFDEEPTIEELFNLHKDYDSLKVIHHNDHVSLFIKTIFDGKLSLRRYAKNYDKILRPFEYETFQDPIDINCKLQTKNTLKATIVQSNSGHTSIYSR